MRLLLTVAYSMIMAARIAATLRGRDPLRLREPASGSLWIERSSSGDADYFSLDNAAEKDANGRFASTAMALLQRAAKKRAPESSASRSADFDRDADIPDEIYTLW